MKPTICLNVIVKASDDSEAAQLGKMLGSVNGYIDAIYVQLNAPKGKKIHPKVREVAEMFADKVFVLEWTNSFVAARQDLLNKTPKKYDWIVWADADDLFDNPQNIRDSLTVMPDNVNGVYILYDYQKDEFGNVIVSHWVTRAIRNNGSFAWKSSFSDDEVSVHETLIATRQSNAVANNEWKIVHNAAPDHYKDSLYRNIELLEGMAQRQSQKPEGIDPRILFYLGSHYNEAYRFNEALELFIEYLKISGWSEERAEAHIFIGRILKNKGRLPQAKNAFLQAMGENPKNPGVYLELGKLEAKDQRWDRAVEWFKRGVELDSVITPMVRYSYDYELLTEYAQALANLGGKHLPEALRMAQKALELRPYDAQAKDNRDAVQKLVEYRKDLRAAARLLNKFDNDEDSLQYLTSLPATLQDSAFVQQGKIERQPAQRWPRKSIAIYVGDSPLGIWGPWSLDEGGIGGSEEAVVRLSKELAQLGWDVTIFGMPGKRAGDYDGTHWRQYWEMNNQDQYDVLISWRQPAFFDFKWRARKQYLWLHDVMPKEELTKERLSNLDKVIYVSNYHANRLENESIKPSKKLASGNGIDPSAFAKYDGKSLRRDNHRVIYMSANERGLRVLLDVWPDVLKVVPDATLTPYYGWQSFDAVNRDNPERMAWKATMVQRMKDLGIPQSTRLGHDELTQEMFQSGIFAYPCIFPEVNCITIQKAQAAGCWPVVSDFAVIPDVTVGGEIVPMHDFQAEDIERYKQALIHRLQNPPTDKQRQELAQTARQTFDWKVVADQWNKTFNEKG